MAKGVNAKVTPASFALGLVGVVMVIATAAAIVHGITIMEREHSEFTKKCNADGGVIVPSRNGEICLPKWIIYGEKNV